MIRLRGQQAPTLYKRTEDPEGALTRVIDAALIIIPCRTFPAHSEAVLENELHFNRIWNDSPGITFGE